MSFLKNNTTQPIRDVSQSTNVHESNYVRGW